MRVLYLSQYFPPEVGATQTRAHEMARGLLRAGHDVTMIAEIPNHPTGIVPEEYRGRLYERSELDGIDVIRVWVWASPVKTFFSRMAFYLSYMVTATLAGLFLLRGRYQVIYATSPPLFVGAAALAISRLRGVPLVFEVRDLWPQSAITLGELRSEKAIRWARTLERCCYDHSRHVVVATPETRDHLIANGIDAAKVTVIRNGANTDLFQFDPVSRERLRKQCGFGDRFVVMYAGLMGLAQGLEVVLTAAKLLNNDDTIQLVLIGDGPAKKRLMELSHAWRLKNVTFMPLKPRESLPSYLSAADAAVVPLVRKRLLGALPSKTFDAMACQLPVIVSARGEVRTVVQKADAGVVVPPGNPRALIEAISQLAASQSMCRRFGLNGRRAVVADYSRSELARQLVLLLEEIAPGVVGTKEVHGDLGRNASSTSEGCDSPRIPDASGVSGQFVFAPELPQSRITGRASPSSPGRSNRSHSRRTSLRP